MLQKFKESDIKALNLAYKSQNIQYELTIDMVPMIGYSYGDVAFGFLRLVEGKIGQIDGLVTNAEYTSDERNQGISEVINALLIKANQLNLKGIVSFTTNESVIKRAEELGFKSQTATIISKNLN